MSVLMMTIGDGISISWSMTIDHADTWNLYSIFSRPGFQAAHFSRIQLLAGEETAQHAQVQMCDRYLVAFKLGVWTESML